MGREKYSYYEYKIQRRVVKKEGYDYKIYGAACYPYDDGIIESDEYYDTEKQARDAVIKHIDLLESGGE
jgi:hypothetical protein